MARTLLPASANLICKHGSHVLLIKRGKNIDTWPGYWAFPGGKIEDGELFRECAFRETAEEIGIVTDTQSIQAETIVMNRTVQGTKLIYFGMVEHFTNSPEVLEPELIDDLAWFSIAELPEPMIPHHRIGLEAILSGTGYTEFDVAP